MAWPTTKATTTSLDSGTDDPNLARPEIKQNVENVNDIIDFLNLTSLTDKDILQYNASNGTFDNITLGNAGLQKQALITLTATTYFFSSAYKYYGLTETSDPYGLISINSNGKIRFSETGNYLFEATVMIDSGNYDSHPYFGTYGGGVCFAQKTGWLGSSNEVYHFPMQKFLASDTTTDHMIIVDTSNVDEPLSLPTNVVLKLTKI
jgi:hypothetical protein